MADKRKDNTSKKSQKTGSVSSLKKKLQDGLRSAEKTVRKSTSHAKSQAGSAGKKIKERMGKVDTSRAGEKAKEQFSKIENSALGAKFKEKTAGIKSSYLWALFITIGLVLWLGSGLIFSGKQEEEQTVRNSSSESTRVQVKKFIAKPRDIIVKASGRTEGFRRVDVLARTTGIILSTPYKEGERVKKGDLLCELDLGVRQARLAEAKAALAEAQLNYDAANELVREGFASKTRLATTEARLDATRAALRQVEIDIDYTRIKAPESGILIERPAEPGSFLQLGGRCARITIQDPILIIANVSEREIGGMKQGLPGKAKLATGRIVEGTVRFVSPAADTSTRTFRIELEVDNKDLSIRDGVSAELSIPIDKKSAHLISPSILTLNKDGAIGVRMLKADHTTQFMPIKIISDGTEGVWIAGLPEEAVLVTVGHEFVRDGEKVNAIGLPPRTTSSEVSQK